MVHTTSSSSGGTPARATSEQTRAYAFDISTIDLDNSPFGGEPNPPAAQLVEIPYLDLERQVTQAPREYEPVYQRKLRIALAMRGGVSLAVWIGGAVAELDLLRRLRIRVRGGTHYGLYLPPDAEKPELPDEVYRRVRLYARLLDAAQYDAVELDVLAGASAGGLNAVMYACAQRAGSDVDLLLDTWVGVGGVWELLRRPGAARVDSVLRGDDYFWIAVRRALESFYSGPRHPLHRTNRLIVDLSATVADGEDATERGTKEGRGHFHFVASAEQPELREYGRAVPDPDSATRDRDLARLALAARSTSAFPGAFEPALIFAKKTGGADEPVLGDSSHIDMTFAFHAHRDDWAHPFRVVDGGVLDNIPIDRAFRAIRNLASEVNTSRALIYLDPDPPVQPLRTLRPLRYGRAGKDDRSSPTSMWEKRLNDRQSTFLAAIRAGTGLRGGSESGADEEDAVEQYRLQLLLASGRTQSLTPFSAAAAARRGYRPAEARNAYVRFRASADPQLFSQILAAPSVWQLSTNLRTRQVWTGWTLEERSGISRRFKTGYTRLSHTPQPLAHRTAVLTGPQALIDAARSGLGWIRALEDLPGSLDLREAFKGLAWHGLRGRAPTSLGGLRLRLYTVLSTAVDARDRCVRETLVAVQEVRDAVQKPVGEREHLVDGLYSAWLDSSARAVAGLAASWDELDDSIPALRALSQAETRRPQPEGPDKKVPDWRQREWEEWQEQPWSRLPESSKRFAATELAPFAAAMGIPEPIARLTYWKITADERPAHPDHFETLHRRKLRHATTTALKLRKEDLSDDVVRRLFQDQDLLADDKLAGTSLAHFAGFLAKAWRQNDWWWGRLDAAAGSVRFLASLIPPIDEEKPVPPGRKHPVDPEPLVEFAQDAVLSQLAPARGSKAARKGSKGDEAVLPFRTPLPAGAWPDKVRESFTLGADTPDDLRPAYLLSILSRGLRVASRALSGSVGFWERMLLVVFRPLLVFVPIGFNPLREALVAAVLGLMIALVGETVAQNVGPQTEELNPAVLICGGTLILVAVLILLRIAVQGLSAWRRVDRTVEGLTKPRVTGETIAQLSAFRRVALPQGWTYAIVSALTLAVAGWELWAMQTLSVSYWILLVSAVVLAIRAGIRFHSPNESPHTVALYLGGLVAYTLWVGVVVLIPWHPEWLPIVRGLVQGAIPPTISVALVVAVAAFLIAVLLTAKWLVLFRNWRTVFLNWFTVSFLAGAAAGGTVYGSAVALDQALRLPQTVFVLVTVVATVVVWGTLVWWLPEIKDGESKHWATPQITRELRKGLGG